MRNTRAGAGGRQWFSKAYRATGIAAAGLVVLGIAACGGDPDGGQAPEVDPGNSGFGTSAQHQQPTGAAEPPAADIPNKRDGAPVETAQAALQTAADAVENGEPFDLELESHGNQVVFDVKVASGGNEVKVLVAANGQDVVSQRQKDKPSSDIAKLDGAQIDAIEALNIAVQQEPDSLLDEIEIDTEDGRVVWEVEFIRPDGSEIEYNVDVNTGDIEID